MNITTREEVERCLPHFIRLCVQRAVDNDIGIDTSAVEVARSFYARLPASTPPDLKEHFTSALSDLVDLASALAPRLPASTLKDYVGKASAAQVASLLERSLIKALTVDA